MANPVTDIYAWQRVPLAFRNAVDECAREYVAAKLKHGERTLDGALADDVLRLSALGEEFGEVCEALTYDKRSDDAAAHAHHLRAELVQVANVALTWASILGVD